MSEKGLFEVNGITSTIFIDYQIFDNSIMAFENIDTLIILQTPTVLVNKFGQYDFEEHNYEIIAIWMDFVSWRCRDYFRDWLGALYRLYCAYRVLQISLMSIRVLMDIRLSGYFEGYFRDRGVGSRPRDGQSGTRRWFTFWNDRLKVNGNSPNCRLSTPCIVPVFNSTSDKNK